jgi:hypothetical protein
MERLLLLGSSLFCCDSAKLNIKFFIKDDVKSIYEFNLKKYLFKICIAGMFSPIKLFGKKYSG